ncbi:MAG: 2-isopropylmalate synthase [Hyphomonadaceae bacterium]|nr:MAG: 2-isopropylmalate synthase [Caulobacteraceae bacterium]MBT9446406.1 2-isopropylmalate synthase [Hyphomonadaceae bacterium]TPW04923.1 MAG: 2-isopropylmalate synthase [Alphaproteobacteria bacterium]
MPAHVKIFDTTMRDGEQSPGASMTLDEKLELAQWLDATGVDVIEAGFPISSNGDFEAVRAVAGVVKESVVCGLSRAGAKDIDRCWEAIRGAQRPRIHSFLSTSPIHRKHKLQMDQDQVLDAITFSVSHARNLCDDVEWSAEDATRTERDFLRRCVEAAIKAGATTINVPDTVGYSFPQEYGEIFADLIASVPGADKVVFSAHCHNDLGLAVANSIAAVMAGARQIECAINGLGERAGNAALEEVVMALRVRGDVLPYETKIDSTRLMRASQMVSRITGFPVQYNKAIVGKNAFSHESGIHQDGMLKNAQTYEIMRPEDVGQGGTSLVLGKLSGRAAFKDKLADLGYELAANEFQDAFTRFKELADRKRHVYDDDIIALVDDQIAHSHDAIQVKRLRVVAGTEGPQTAELDLEIDGEHRWTTARGNGPVDAIFAAIRSLIPHDAKLDLYQVHAVTEGTDAQAEVSVRLIENGRVGAARAADADTLVASAKAYVAALNRLAAKRAKGQDAQESAA